MLKIYLARHGQDQDNALGILNGRRDQPLTEKGLEQAQEVAHKIRNTGLTFDHTYSSPLKRAYTTAEIITDTLKIQKPEVMPELIERDFGSMTGVLQNRIPELCAPDILQTETITYFLKPDGAETFPDLIVRAKTVLEKINTLHTSGHILLVTHGDFGKMLYTAYYNLDWVEVLKMFHFGNSELLELSEESSPTETHVFTIHQHNT